MAEVRRRLWTGTTGLNLENIENCERRGGYATPAIFVRRGVKKNGTDEGLCFRVKGWFFTGQ